MNNTPKISVILPVFNGMKYLEESVNSVLNQNYNDYEFLICDDCSTDESFSFLQSNFNNKIKWSKNKQNLGLFPTLNLLIKQAQAPLIHLWAQDDIMLPNCLEETVKFHNQFPEVKFSFSRLQGIDRNGKLLKPPSKFPHKTLSPEGHAISSLLFGSISGNIANVCIVKKAIENAGYFDETMKYVGDFDMWCKLSKNTAIGMNGKVLVHVRQHSAQFSKNIDASLFKLKENLKVYNCFLQTLKPEIRKPAKKALKWKVYPTYFTQFLFILRNIKLKLAFKYLKTLNNYNFIPFLIFKWIIVYFLKIIKKEQQFYTKFFYKPIENARVN